MTTPLLTDRKALFRARSRAQKRPGGMADFLHRTMADDLEERLQLVNRTFTEAVVVSDYPALWAELMPSARHHPSLRPFSNIVTPVASTVSLRRPGQLLAEYLQKTFELVGQL